MSWLTTNTNGKNIVSSFVLKLIQNNTGVSIKSFFLLIITTICFILLLLPIAAIIVDLINNHTVTMSWSDIGVYIGAVFSGATGAGLVKAWSEKYERYAGPDGILGTEDDIIVKRNIFSNNIQNDQCYSQEYSQLNECNQSSYQDSSEETLQ